MSISPRVTLVGAGPGDPDLISLKGVKALQSADAVLYDALVDESLLEHVPKEAELLYVGKRVGACQFKQEDINKLIVEYAQKYGHAVRLKGGDPFVFGRGQEEKLFVESHGIPVEVVPGISSSYSVPELAGVPLTRRGDNESFWVITGTTRNHELSEDVRLASKSRATVVILMGMRKLEEIVSIFQQEGKGATPVAIIQNGSRPTEKRAFGTVDTIVEEVKEKGMDAPAVIVIGEVVRWGNEDKG